ncbi:aminoglycoside 6-adenylyltransferase [Lacticaseibacillus porcinae]|uniref:aminoglycoside 6-adenylyltransferase n=1 Tax=Lacticaseibacillus porcinae TaxID=1123687 RepID=UPI000F76B9E2|nr:aminoglycoside 6-adenylyltransferase [Lacticaseibacillus porcinae]
MSEVAQIFQLAAADPRVVAIGTEGSRNDPAVSEDAWSDLDVTVFVRESLGDDAWTKWVCAFGEPVIWQHLLNRDLFGESSEIWDTYLVRYAGTRRIDWKFAPIADLENYLAADTLNQIVWREGQVLTPQATHSLSHTVQLPTAAEFFDAVNEVLWCAGNVAKALHRGNLVHANEQLNENVRPGVLQLLSWQLALIHEHFNAGSHWKFLANTLSEAERQQLVSSYAQGDLRQARACLQTLIDLCETASRDIAKHLKFQLPAWFEPGLRQLREW